MLLLLLACTQPEPTQVPWTLPDGVTHALHDPDHSLTTWPDDAHTAPDAARATGLRVQLRDGARAALEVDLTPQILIFEGLDDLDGFGTNGGAYLQFSAPLDEATIAGALHGVDLETGAPVTFDVSTTDEGATILANPRFPLQERHRYAWVVDDSLRDAAGEPVWPGPWVHAALAGEIEPALSPDLRRAASLLGLAPEQVVDATVFTTQSLFAGDDEAVALLRDQTATWTLGACVVEGDLERCEHTLNIADLVGPAAFIDPDDGLAIQGRYDLPITLYLPWPRGPEPLPVILHGHGLSGDRHEARGAAQNLAGLGFAVATVDAPMHGDHPTNSTDADLLWVLQMFGISLDNGTFDPRVLRDSFRRAAWDKVQVAAALRASPDVTGDGVADLDGGFIAWTGHSLGGLLGPQLQALDPQIAGSFLSVPGGRMADIVHLSGTFAPLIALMAPPGTSTGAIDRFFPVLQACIERGDPATWAVRMAEDRRDLWVVEVLDDEIMPNPTTDYLSRALGVQHAGPVIHEIPELPMYEGTSPVSGNVDGKTAALWQYEEAHFGGQPARVDHSDVFDADEHVGQMRAFLDSLRRDGRATVPDPGAP